MSDLAKEINKIMGIEVENQICTNFISVQEKPKLFFEISKYKRAFKCSVCGKILKEKGNIKTHQRIHTGERSFICMHDGCNKSFITLDNLNSHVCNHTGVRPFKCTFEACDKTYSRLSRLRIHERTHMNNKPYECVWENCGKKFNEKGNLKTHYRVHTGEKPFKCTYQDCNQAFKALGHLKDHMKRHFNIRPFKCYLCNAKFARTSTLKIHLCTHENKEIIFSCTYYGCNEKFTDIDKFKFHLKEHSEKKILRNANKIEAQENVEIKQAVPDKSHQIQSSSFIIRISLEEINKVSNNPKNNIINENEQFKNNIFKKNIAIVPPQSEELTNLIYKIPVSSTTNKEMTNNPILIFLFQNILQRTPDINSITTLINLSYITKISMKNLLALAMENLNEIQHYFDLYEIQLCINLLSLNQIMTVFNISASN